MPLSAEQVYNHLNGEEVRDILTTRIADLFSQVREFSRTITHDRIRMTVDIRLEVQGRTPPAFRIKDDLVVRSTSTPHPPSAPEIEADIELHADISTNPEDDYAQAPDEVRVEHGVPVMVPTRTPMGIQDFPHVDESGRKYGAFITQDKGSAMRGDRDESRAILPKNFENAPNPEVGIQGDFKTNIMVKKK